MKKNQWAQAVITATLLASLSFGAIAGPKNGRGLSKSCMQIVNACKSAGFIQGDWKKGDGLWRNCIDPIIQGQTGVAGGTKPLPTVDPNIVAECKASRPSFGTGKKPRPAAGVN